MSRPEGNSRPAKPGTGPAGAGDDPTLDPDATRIVPAPLPSGAAPLERMPPITAANRAAPPAGTGSSADAGSVYVHDDGPETVQQERDISFIDPTFPDTFSIRAGRKPADIPVDNDHTVIAPASLLMPRGSSEPVPVPVPVPVPAAPAAQVPPPAAPFDADGNETVIVPASKLLAAAQQGAARAAAAAAAQAVPGASSGAGPVDAVSGGSTSASNLSDSSNSSDDDNPASEFAETVLDPDAVAAVAALRAMPEQEPGRRPSTGTLPGGALAAGRAAASAEAPLRQVGRYQILDRIGRGGMASVFKAHDPGIGRDVAIKFLHASLCEDEEYRSRFLREARASGGLSHPNIVTVHDVGEIDGRPYMAMELLDGEPLADILEPGQPLPIRDTVVMAIQLARALDYAHKRGIVHRDIKPGNIARVRGTLDIKVMDFGIAHMESTKGEQRTRVGDVLGTPQYMSPEQMNGEKIDGRADLFSAGIVMYQMLTGQRPFTGDSVVSLALKIAKEDPTPLNKLRPGIPASLRRVVDRCLAKAPEHRFQTGTELADALIKVLGDIDEEARVKGGPKLIPLRVKWAAMMAGIVAVVMAVTGSLIVQRQNEALMQQVADYGSALARFIAAQNATAALGEDWVAVDVSLQEIMKTRDFSSVTVVDRAGVVAASSQTDAVGKPYQAPTAEALGEQGGIKRTRYHVGESPVLGFEVPITFQDKQVGRVALGLPERPLESVARLSRTLMAVLAVVTVLAVAIAMFFVANWFSRPIKLVVEALDEIGRGRVDFRIREQRKDEFGLLYAAFDRMAQALQDKQALAASAAKAAAPVTVGPAPAASVDAALEAQAAAARGTAPTDDTLPPARPEGQAPAQS